MAAEKEAREKNFSGWQLLPNQGIVELSVLNWFWIKVIKNVTILHATLQTSAIEKGIHLVRLTFTLTQAHKP